MTYYVYLIVAKVKNRTISYVGYTNNLNKRIKLHNANKGAKFTKGKKWKLVYYEKYDSKNEAMKNEYSLKKNYTLRNKLKIGKKIESINNITI
jgi:putative endonuclease